MTAIYESRDTGIPVTAMKYTGGLLNVEKINNWIRSAGRQSRWEMPEIGHRDDGSSYRTREEHMEIRTTQGWKPVQLGEWIVRFSSGHFWSFTPSHFRDQYRPVTSRVEKGNHMNEMNVASYVKRPDEYKALKFDTVASYETMCRWLHEMAMQHVRWTERFGFIDGPYIEFTSFDKSHKVFPGMWVVISEKDGSTEVLHDVAFKQRYMAAEAQYRGTESEYEEKADVPIDKPKPKDPRKFSNVVAWDGKLYTEREDGSVDEFGHGDPTPPPWSHYETVEADGYVHDQTRWNNQTIFKVDEVLKSEFPLATETWRHVLIEAIMKAGILFREPL